jgi:hypothetical protein
MRQTALFTVPRQVREVQSAVTKHALSGDSASEIDVPARRNSAPVDAQTLKKKAFARRQK